MRRASGLLLLVAVLQGLSAGAASQSTPLRILHDLLLAAVSRVRGELPIGDFAPIVAPTSDVRRATLCAVSGMIATTYCVRRVSDWVPVDEPVHDCTWHHQSERGLVTIWPRNIGTGRGSRV